MSERLITKMLLVVNEVIWYGRERVLLLKKTEQHLPVKIKGPELSVRGQWSGDMRLRRASRSIWEPKKVTAARPK